MMRLSTLWNVDRTIDEHGSSPVAKQIVARWDHDPGSTCFFRSSANFIYQTSRDGQRCYLRFAADAERTRPAIDAEMAVVTWLGQEGINVVEPIVSRAGNLVETVETEHGTFHAVLFAGVAGEQHEPADLQSGKFETWGAALGRLHVTLSRYPDRDRRLSAPWSLVETVEFQHPDVQGEANLIAAALNALPRDDDAWGILHGDAELDNLIWTDNGPVWIDFDGCGRGWYAADVAFALAEQIGEGFGAFDLQHPAVRAFVSGYRQEHALDDEMLLNLPLFSRLERLMDYAVVKRSLDLDESDAETEWMRALIRRFRRFMAEYETSLAR